MKKPLCISAYVFKNYTKYIPYYIYSILKSYPDYFVKIFCMDDLPLREKKALDIIRNQLSSNFLIKENYFPFPNIKKTKEGKPLRYLIPESEFAEFDNVYIGDVDFLIVKEEPSILEGHLEHCEKIGLPYSNQIRPRSNRMTGLHFIKVKEYYKAMSPIIERYNNNLELVISEMEKFRSDEQFLYKIVEEGIGFGKINEHLYRPHHGFHLGIMRINRFEKYIAEGSSRQIHNLPPYPILRKQLLEYYKDPVFQEICKVRPLTEVKKLKKKLDEIKKL